jgi:tripartite-type tricarboxylate transporter receptor subunit TctC
MSLGSPVSAPTSTSVVPVVSTAKARVIDQASRQRLRSLANVPTVFEVLPNYPMGPSRFGLFGPAGTATPAIQRLNAEANKARTDPQVIARLDALGLQSM